MQERRSSSALAMELRLSCTNPSKYSLQTPNSSLVRVMYGLSHENSSFFWWHFDGLVQERCNSSTLAMELCLSCTNPLIWCFLFHRTVVERSVKFASSNSRPGQTTGCLITRRHCCCLCVVLKPWRRQTQEPWLYTAGEWQLSWRMCHKWINSLWSSDIIWWHKSGTTLIQVMTCCFMSPSYNLNQCWFITNRVIGIHMVKFDWMYSKIQSLTWGRKLYF